MALSASFMSLLLILFGTSAAIADDSGDSSPSANPRATTHSTPSTTRTAASNGTGYDLSGPASNTRNTEADTSAAPAISASTSALGASSTSKHAGAAATGAAATPISRGTENTAGPPIFTAALTTSVNATALADATTEAATAKAMASPAAAPPCVIDVTRNFGSACFAAATTTLSDGSSRSFPNAKAGYRGSTTATCKSGTVIWSQEACNEAPLLTSSAAASLSATHMSKTAALTMRYNVGVYYFGGWKDKQLGASSPMPWTPLKRYPDREPLLGYYAEDASGVLNQQLKWMQQAGINFVVFNWYWARHNAPMLDHAIKAYLAIPNKSAVHFAVQWSNHTETNFTRDQLDAMFKYWIANYFKRPEYQLYNGKPVVYIFSAAVWARNAAAIGMTSAQLIEWLNNTAKAAGLPGVSVVGGMWGGDKAQDYSTKTGFAALTIYNYHSPANIALQPLRSGNNSHSYAELHQSYANQWDWMIKNTQLNYVVPMTSGWDKRPWGGSKDPLHDDSRSLPAEFAIHLQAAKAFMDANSSRTMRTGVICCWNEFGEGSFIEPSKADGTKYLDQVRTIFGNN